VKEMLFATQPHRE